MQFLAGDVVFVKKFHPRLPLIRLGLLLTLLLMTINLNNSATDKIPPSDKICPLIQWILISMVFILVALVEYFLILVVLRFRDKVSENKSIHLLKHYILVCLSEEKIWEGARQQKPGKGLYFSLDFIQQVKPAVKY